MYNTNIKNKILLLLNVFQGSESKYTATAIKKNSGKINNKSPIKKNTPNVEFHFNKSNKQYSEMLTEILKIIQEAQTHSMEQMIPILIKYIVESMFANIPEKEKQDLKNAPEKIKQMEILLEKEMRNLLEANKNKDLDAGIVASVEEFLKSDINLEVIYVVKLLSMIFPVSNSALDAFFEKYKEISEAKTALESEIQAKQFIAMSMQTPVNESDMEELTKKYTSLATEMELMLKNDLGNLIDLVIKIIREEVKNKENYNLKINGKKISLTQMLTDIEQNKENQTLYSFVGRIFLTLLPTQVK